MKVLGKFLLLVFLLNAIRYLIGGPLESLLIVENMHSVMPQFPEVFDTEFSNTDFTVSLFYNFMMWLTATWVFYLAHPVVKGHYIIRSLKIFALMGLFFISLAAIYMNHFSAEAKPFFLYSMIDALILFPIVGFANGILFPKIFEEKLTYLVESVSSEEDAGNHKMENTSHGEGTL